MPVTNKNCSTLRQNIVHVCLLGTSVGLKTGRKKKTAAWSPSIINIQEPSIPTCFWICPGRWCWTGTSCCRVVFAGPQECTGGQTPVSSTCKQQDFFFFFLSPSSECTVSPSQPSTHTHTEPHEEKMPWKMLWWISWYITSLLKKKNTHEIHYFTHTHTHTLRCAWWIQKTYCGELFCVSSLNFWNFFLPSRHCQLCLDLTALPKSMHVLKATYVAMPWSMIPPNRTAVVWSSRSGYWGKKRCSSNKFLSMHWNTSCENKTKSIHTHRPHCNHCITL